MSLTTSTIVGRIAFPDNTPLAGGVIEFALSSFDTQGVNLVPGLSDARFTLDADGNIPAGAQLWRNTSGIRGTRYTVSVRSTDYACPYHAFTLGEIEVGNAASYELGELLAMQSDGLAWLLAISGNITTSKPDVPSTPLLVRYVSEDYVRIEINAIYVVAETPDFVTLEAI